MCWGTATAILGKVVFGADLGIYSAQLFGVRHAVKSLSCPARARAFGWTRADSTGHRRYSASQRQDAGGPVPIYVSALDFVGKRTALFGMTRTGKSNTVKKILESICSLSSKSVIMDGQPLKPVGQIIFDVNGEYANANQQDEGTAIFEMFAQDTTRYSLIDKPGFSVMKLNFHGDLEAGFGLLQSFLNDDTSDYVRSFLSVDLSPAPSDDEGAKTRKGRVIGAYQACLFAAAFALGNAKIKFQEAKSKHTIAAGR